MTAAVGPENPQERLQCPQSKAQVEIVDVIKLDGEKVEDVLPERQETEQPDKQNTCRTACASHQALQGGSG